MRFGGGTFQVYPSYAKTKGYRVGIPGCYVAEMRGERKKKIFLWTDDEFIHLMSKKE